LGKGEFDPQTIADRAAQKCIITSLQKKFPAIKIVGEEVYLFKNIKI
jgi:3'(2'), 5'-bisphosphate nucleotidase